MQAAVCDREEFACVCGDATLWSCLLGSNALRIEGMTLMLQPAPTGTVPPEWGGMVNLKRVQLQDSPLLSGALGLPEQLLVANLAAATACSSVAVWRGMAAQSCELRG